MQNLWGNELLVTSSERTEETKTYFQGKFLGSLVSQMWFQSAEFGVKRFELLFLTYLLCAVGPQGYHFALLSLSGLSLSISQM